MKDLNKSTKAELISELELLRSQFARISDISKKDIPDPLCTFEDSIFFKLAEASHSSILIYTKKNVHYVNNATIALSGYSKAELLKMNFWDIIHPADLETIKARGLARLSGEKIPNQSEFRIITKNKEIRWLDFAGDSVIHNGELATVGIALDITEKKIAEEQLRENEEGYRTLFEGANDAIFIMQGGLFISCNEKTLQMYQCSLEQITGKSPIDFSPAIQPDGRSSKESAEEKINLAYQGLPQYFEWVHTHLDGTPFDAEVGLNKIEVQGVPYLQAIVRDITERKKTEAALKESESQLRNIIEMSNISMAIVNFNGIIEYINRQAIKTFGYLHEEIPDMEKWWMLAYPDKDYREKVVHIWMGLLEKAIKDKSEIERREYFTTCKDGTVKTMIIFGVVVDDKVFVMFEDITERKKIEDAIKHSEAQFRIIFENAPIGMCLTGTDNRFIAVNRSLCNMLGYTKEEMQYSPVAKFTHPDDVELSKTRIQQDISEKSVTSNFVKRYIHKDGHIIWVSISSSLFKEKDGSSKYLIAQVLDITEQRKEEEANRLNEARLEVLVRLNNLADRPIEQLTDYTLEEAVKLTGSKFGYLAFMNEDESVIMLHSWSSEVMNICKVRGSYHKFDVAKTGLLSEPIRQRKPVITNNYSESNPLKHGFPEGHVPITRHLNVPIFDGERIVILAGVANKDSDYDESDVRQLTLLMNGIWGIIQRKRNEEAIVESEERYRIITDNSNDIIVKFGTNGKISFVSPACKILLGYDSHQMIGQSVFKFFHPDDVPSLRTYEKDLLNKVAQNIVKHRLIKSDGSYVWFETNNQIILDAEGKIKEVVAVCRDITFLLKSESLKKEKEAAEFASKAKSEFLANMSHEIRNPLNSIIGLSNTLSRSELNDENKEIVESIKISSGNLLNIINDILDFSKIEANKVQITNNNFTVDDIINDVYSSFKTITEHKKLDFSFAIEKDIPPVLYGDSGKLKQMIINLVSNAVKFTEAGFVSILVKKSKSEKRHVYLKFEIADSGIGIKKEDFGRLFQSFAQLDSSTTKSYSGTGLGLAITNRYANLMNGKVDYTSKFGKGSTFILEIPFRIPSVEKSEKELAPADIVMPKSRLIVLLAEDDGINQLYMKSFLAGKGMDVDTAFNGLQVIEKYDSKKYDLILMDGQMPKMDGFEATRIIRGKEKISHTHIPIIALTGYAVSGDREKFLETGMDDYISKPIDENKLMELIRRYVEKD